MITFKKIEEPDLEFVLNIRNECCKEYLHDSDIFTIKEAKDWFAKTTPQFWIIYLDDKRIGYFRTSDYSKLNRNIYIGADLHVDYRNQGLGYHCYMKFIPFIFDKLNLHKIFLEVLETNRRAISLYLKLGFKIEGVKKDAIYKKGWIDSIIMGLKK